MISFITAFDVAAIHLITASRSDFFIALFTILTQLGDVRWIMVIALAMAIVAWRHKRFEYKAGLAVALLGSLGTSYLIKILIQRARPDSPFALIDVAGYSFPSMHATVSLATYGFLAFMIFKLMHPPRVDSAARVEAGPPHHRMPWILFLSVLILLIGFSRVYLGVHYLSDVLGGFVIGALFLWLGIYTVRQLGSSRGS